MRKVLLFLSLSLLALSCKDTKSKSEYVISTYNMYLFFDGYYSGVEYSPFKQTDGYTYEVYKERVKLTSKYIAKHMGNSDVIVFQEVENSSVLKDLLDAGLKKQGFKYYGFAESSDVFSVGYISKSPPVEANIHSVDSSRPILELLFCFGGEEMSIYTLHAASKLNDGNEALRYELFSLLATLLSLNKDRLIAVLGDFNADIKEGEEGIASDDNALSLTSAIVATKDMRFSDNHYFSPMLLPGEIDGDGTYFYQGKWYFLDNILLSKEAFDYRGLEYKSTAIVSPMEAKDTSGFPLKFDVKSKKGFSDHFALKLTLSYK